MCIRKIAENIGPLSVILVAALVTASAKLSSLLALDVTQVYSGELWRLMSGHLAHLTWQHYLIDALVFWALFSAYAAKRGSKASYALMTVAALSVSIAVVALGMHAVYGGLSGLGCAAFAALILAMVLDDPKGVYGYALAVLFCTYLLLGQHLVAGISVANEAHWAGAFAGAATEGIRYYFTRSLALKEQIRA